MFEELVKALRICEDGTKCDLCPKWHDKQNGGLIVCQTALCKEAADAIVELITEHASLVARAAVAEEALRKRRPRGTGRWVDGGKSAIFLDDVIYRCSECGYRYFMMHHYCPNCGADMREES